MRTQTAAAAVLIQLWLTVVRGENQAPRFTQDMNGFSLSESTSKDTIVFQLKGMDPENDSLQFGMDSDAFEVRNASTGNVFVSRTLDYELERSYRISVWISDGVNRVDQRAQINILDNNDELPTFTQQTYKITIAENAKKGYVVYRNMTVRDADAVGSLIQVTCVNTAADPLPILNWCSVFHINVTHQSNREWVANLVLTRALDYETTKQPTQLRLEAFDGKNTNVKSVEIELVDVQDTAPKFSGSITAVINENVLTSEKVITIVARDEDGDSNRPIRYSLVSNPGGLFSIDQVSGDVITTGTIDRETDLLKGGFVKIRVKACEMYNATTVDTARFSCSEVEVTVTVIDLNDNAPIIVPQNGVFDLEEDIETGVTVPEVELTVTDKDLGAKSEFQLELMNYADMFKVVPNVGTGRVTAHIVVLDADLIDFDLKQKKFELHIVARETKTAEPRTSDAYITLNLQDVNDNSPVFTETDYEVDVRETASSRTPVITITASDLDSGLYGTNGILYRLSGVGSEFFIVDPNSGAVTVRGCFNPGQQGCMDYEHLQTYNLRFMAMDDKAEGNRHSVPLTINILNENDNKPKFNLPSYVSYIQEGEMDLQPPLTVQATDADNDPVTYTILNGNGVGTLWAIDPVTGDITPTAEVDYETTPGGLGYYNLTIQASDGLNSVTATARIFVIDSNDHEPVFNPAYYEVSIPEDTLPGELVETVLATDADPSSGPNGQIQYRVTGGSLDMFIIHPTNGQVSVAPSATLDYDVKKQYTMTVVGQDQGQPQKQAEATVVVNILDANNKNPFFRPATIRTEVLENAAVTFSVITVRAEDPDSAAELVYYFEDPRTAIDPNSNPVDAGTFDYTSLFSIERDTGVVKVNQPLSYNTVARVTFTVRVVDNSAVGPTQSAQATVIISVLKVNDLPPIFGPPWSPQRPILDVSVREAQSEGSYITTLVASDPTDTIDEYRLLTNPGGHFEINPQTGVVTVLVPLDYETDKSHQVVVVAIDSGQPQLTATATINVAIVNVNDENPSFGTDKYEVEIYENSPGGTLVVRVLATDLDLEDYGVVKYELDGGNGWFVIDELTGQITVLDGAVLDRETEPVITLTAKVYDSPNNPDVRRFSYVPVYIQLIDVNDNSPSLMQPIYSKNILENVPPATSVLQLTSFDEDEGDNAKVTYEIISGNEDDFFSIDPDTGLVSTNNPLLGHVGTYNLTIQVTDGGGGGGSNTGTSLLRVTVLPANNGAPTWIIPSESNTTVNVLENQYLGMEVTTVYATDEDVVTYGFQYGGQFVSETPDFEINPYTGVITARQVFDREEKDSYTLLLVARDAGSPPFDSQRYLIIQILDTDDHDPEFPTFRNCCAIPYEVQVAEDKPTGTLLGQVFATDRDIGANADIQYYILSGNDHDIFRLDASSGQLFLNGELNYEVRGVYELIIEAQDGDRSPPQPGPACRCQNPGLVKLIVRVQDKNDFGVVFPVDEFFTACVPLDASIGLHVTTIIATDPDTDARTGFNFELSNLMNHIAESKVKLDAFVIGATNGSVYTNTLMSNHEEEYFTMNVRVRDQGGIPADTELKVWVTSPSQAVTLTFQSTMFQVEAELQNILAAISRLTNNGIVCVEDLRYHVNDNGVVIKDWTDLVVYVVDGSGFYVLDAGTAEAIIGDSGDLFGAYGLLEVKETYGFWGGFVTWPILVAFIVIAVLILCALLLLCLLCYCCKWGTFYEEDYYAVKDPIVYTDTINPLWKLKMSEYEDQELTMSMKDYAQAAGTVNPAFEATEGFANGSAARHIETQSHMSASRMEDAVDAVTTNDVRIEAGLEASRTDLSMGPRIEADLIPPAGAADSTRVVSSSSSRHVTQTSSSLHVEQMASYEAPAPPPSRPSMISEATMTDTRQPAYVAPPISPAPSSTAAAASHRAPAHHGPALIGATLTTRQYRQKVIGETDHSRGGGGGYHDSLEPRVSSTYHSATQPPSQQPPHRHESVQNSSYYGEPVFASAGSMRDLTSNYGGYADGVGGGGQMSPGLSSPDGHYEGTIHLGTLSTGGSVVGAGRHYRETHERREYEEGYIGAPDDSDGVFVYPS